MRRKCRKMKINCRIYFPFIAVIALSFTGFAQPKSNRGKEFWLGYGFMYGFIHVDGSTPANDQTLVLYLSAEEPANVTVSVANTGWSQSIFIPANTVNASVVIPKSGAADARILNEGVFDHAVHIVSDTPIVAFAHVYNTMVSGATMLMPVNTYGYKYHSLNYSQSTSASTPPAGSVNFTQNGPDWYSWFYAIATEDSTRIIITPSDTTTAGWLPGQSYTVNLNKGQIYNVMGKMIPGNSALYAASKDMTGSKVISVPGGDGRCHPIALFSGSSGIRLCRGDGGEYMQQQVFPLQAWGTRYLTYHTLNNTSTNINDPFKNFYRIGVSDPATVVKRNGTVLNGLVNGFYYEFLDSTGGDLIESDKPVLVAQYTPGGNRCYLSSSLAIGDPEMFYLSSLEQSKKDVLFYATRSRFIDYNYLNVIIPTNGIASLTLDGNPFLPANIKPHPNHPGYSVAVARMNGPSGQHRLRSDSGFVATVYGLGYFESYGYNTGTFINNLNYFSEISNSLSSYVRDTFTCPGTPVKLFVKLGYAANSITWNFSQCQGVFPNTDITVNNPVPVTVEQINGRTYYTYTLNQDFVFQDTGTYQIPIVFSANVIENCSQTENAMVVVAVLPGPQADFSFSGNTCLNDSLRLTGIVNQGSFQITGYEWQFDDNSTSSSLQTTKQFSVPGIQHVRFSVIASNGCKDDTVKTILLKDIPQAAIDLSGSLCSMDSVLLSDISSMPGGNVTTRYWDFGDNTSDSVNAGAPFYHHYSSAGNYTVSLVVRSDNGCLSDTAFFPLSIAESPVAYFVTGDGICAGDSILLHDSSYAPGSNVSSWSWDFADGSTSIRNDTSSFYHFYSNPGNYQIKLLVQAANGCVSDAFPKTITVNARPVAGFSFSGLPCVGSLINFNSSLNYDPANPALYYWEFGDGQTALINNSNSVTYAYANSAANIPVRHAVSYGSRCSSDTVTRFIPIIHPNPTASFLTDRNSACENEMIAITSPVSGNLTWSWNFGNGSGNQVPPFSISYSTAGSYIITLKVTSPDGCISEVADTTMLINPVPDLDAGPDKYIIQGSSTTLDASLSNLSAQSITWTPSVYLNNTSILNPVSTPDSTTTYVISVSYPNTNCRSTDSMTVFVFFDLYVPNAFTPNGDGINDKWGIPGLAVYPEAEVIIFNRYGQVVYRKTDYYNNPWNGYYRGSLQPTGAYVYQIQLKGSRTDLLKGTVLLLR